MRRFHKTSITYILIITFCWYSGTGCGSGSSTYKQLEKYDDLEYSDVATFYASPDEVHKAVVLAFQQKGYFISLSDANAGLVSGEIHSTSPLPEEEKHTKSDKPSAGEVFVVVLGIILLVGIIAMIVSDTSDDKSDTKETGGLSVSASSPEVVQSYRYILTCNISAMSDSTSSLHLSALRLTIENSATTGSINLENKYINYGFFDAIQDQLNAIPQK